MESRSLWLLVASATGIVLICNLIIYLVKKIRIVRRLASFPSAPRSWLSGHLKHVSYNSNDLSFFHKEATHRLGQSRLFRIGHTFRNPVVYIIRLVTWEAIFVRVKWPYILNVDNAFGVDLLDCNLDSCFRNSIVNRLWMYFLPLVSFFHLLPFVASRFSSLPFDWREKQKFYFQWQSLRELSVFICWACISPPVYFWPMPQRDFSIRGFSSSRILWNFCQSFRFIYV